MEIPTDEEMGEAIESITFDIISYGILDDIQKEERWQKEVVNLLQHYFYENGINCSLDCVRFAFLEWLKTGSNLAIFLSYVYPPEDGIKFREHFAVRDLPCILNGISPNISLEAKRWMYANPTFINDIFIINDAILSKKLTPINADGQSVAIYDDFLSDTRLLHITNIIEWIDNELKRDGSFPIRCHKIIVEHRKSLPEYLDYKEENEKLQKEVEQNKQKIIDLENIAINLREEKDINPKSLGYWCVLAESFIAEVVGSNPFLSSERDFYNMQVGKGEKKYTLLHHINTVTKRHTDQVQDDEPLKEKLNIIREKARSRIINKKS